jgi:hypothetical protein
MIWKYYIPHTWDSPEERTTWEDVWLLPMEAGFELGSASLWLTLDAALAEEPEELREFFAAVEEALEEAGELDRPGEEEDPEWIPHGDQEYRVKSELNMEIKAEDFDMPELLYWVRVFLVEYVGDPHPVLEEGSYEDFEGTNQHARIFAELERMIVEREGLTETDREGD